MILQRHLLADGNVAFTIGTRKNHVENKYPFDIPLGNILDYVSPQELTRYETQDFIREDEKEEEERQLKLLRKPRGRPKKTLQDSSNQASPRDVHFETPATGKKRGRGRPRKVSSLIPSFNGPQPVPMVPMRGLETTLMDVSSEMSSDESITPRRQQYSMVTASGLLPPDISEEDTSREVSRIRTQLPGIEPVAKRRRTTSNSPKPVPAPLPTPIVRIPQTPNTGATPREDHTSSKTVTVDLANEISEGERIDTVNVQSGANLDNSKPVTSTDKADKADKEREALLQQFLTRDTLATRAGTSSSQSSSDSLMSQILVAHRRHSIHPPPLTLAKPTSTALPTIATMKPTHRTITFPQDTRETYTAHPATTNKSTYRRRSMTPHFPEARSANRNKSTPSKAAPRPHLQSPSTWQSATMIRPPAKSTKPTISMSPPPERRQAQGTTSRFKIRPLEPTNDIRKFFKPKYNPISTQECADSTDEDSEPDTREDGLSTRITGFLKPKYAPVKQESGSENEHTDEEEDSDGPITHNSSPRPQAPEVQPARRDSPLRQHHQHPPSIKEEVDDSSNSTSPSPSPSPIDLIPRSTIPSPPPPPSITHHHTAMDIEETEISDSNSEQDEYLSAEEPEPELGPGIDVSVSSSVRDIHTGAELDADTEEDSEDEGKESGEEVLVVGRGLGRERLKDV